MYKRVFTILILLLLFLLPQSSKAIDTTSIKFFPLQVGNFYVYDYTYAQTGQPTIYSIIKAEITDTTTINDNIYYRCIGFPRFNNKWVRTDTITGSLYEFDNSYSCPNYYYEKSIDSLAANINDTITSCGAYYYLAKCYLLNQINIFGQSFIEKGFSYHYNPSPYSYINGSRRYIKNIGPSRFSSGSGTLYSSYSSNYILKGCIINGMIYGDTTMTNIKNISTETPSDFKLFQNYPNPFNPSTNIKFSIPKSSHVILSIYNILGKELTTLVNEKVNAGIYEVNWNAANFSNGVYFYKLIADDFIDTKRMLLIK